MGRLFGLLDWKAVEKSFRGWVSSVLPGLAKGSVVAIDGKASRRSKMTGQQALHLVSAFATGARLVLGQEACAEKSNELTAIPVLLDALLLKSVIGSFLTSVWKEGGLQGASPVDAFSVQCGLGTTMTAEDVLNGLLMMD